MGYKTVSLNYPITRVAQKDPDGCGIASATMDVNFVKGTNYTYEDIKSANDNVTTVDWSKIARNEGLDHTRIPSGGAMSDFATLKTDLFNELYYNERPVIVYVKNNSTGGQHFVVVNGFQGTLAFFLDEGGVEYPSPAGATAAMFKIVDPGYTDHYTLADVMNHYSGDLKTIHFFY